MFTLTTDGTIGCVMSGSWCQMLWHLVTDAGPIYLVQCIQQSYTQGQDCLCQPTVIAQGRGTHKGALQRCKYPIWATYQTQKQPQIQQHSGPQQHK